MKIGCHAAVFGRQRMATEPEAVFQEIAATGFEGFECNNAFVVGDNESKFNDLLAKYNLELSALHFAGSDWLNKPDEAIEAAVKIAKYLTTQPSKNIEMSGMWHMFTEEADIITACKNINRAAHEVAQMGVALNYHNHNWEFVNDVVYKSLRDYAGEMKFGFDIGWMARGGYEVIPTLKANRGRVQYVHIRDPKKLDCDPKDMLMSFPKPGEAFKPDPERMKKLEFPDLGDGETDLKGQINFLNGYLPEDGWMVVEYETGAPDYQRYVRAKKLIDEMLLVK